MGTSNNTSFTVSTIFMLLVSEPEYESWGTHFSFEFFSGYIFFFFLLLFKGKFSPLPHYRNAAIGERDYV